MMSESREKKGAVVDGFYFPDNPEAEQAKKEKEGIRFIREKSAMDGPEAVLKLYNRMIQQNLFETAVGYTYLKDLQEYLLSVPEISREDILPIRVRHPVSVREAAQQTEGGKAPEKNKEEKEKRVEINLPAKYMARLNAYRKRYRAALVVCAFLIVCVAAMFVITATSDNATILNYESKLIDRYEHWEEELKEREAKVREREEAAGISVQNSHGPESTQE